VLVARRARSLDERDDYLVVAGRNLNWDRCESRHDLRTRRGAALIQQR